MALIVFENNSNGTLLADIDNSQTTIALAGGQGANFPDPAVDEIFYVTLHNYAAQLIEICRVTDRTVDSLTVNRGVDGSTPKAWAVADTAIQLRLTKETLDRFVQTGAPLTPGSVLTVDSQGQLVDRTGSVLTEVTYESYTSTEGQDVFNTTVDLPVVATGIIAYINGVRQLPPANFTRTGLNQITFDETLAVGDAVVIGA
jgi:hypothetical protein